MKERSPFPRKLPKGGEGLGRLASEAARRSLRRVGTILTLVCSGTAQRR